jgi:hypothetical protein
VSGRATPGTPASVLDLACQRAARNTATPLVRDSRINADVEYVCRNIQNRAGVRLLMSCLLAKIHNPAVDVRKPRLNARNSGASDRILLKHVGEAIGHRSLDLTCRA